MRMHIRFLMHYLVVQILVCV